jgi:alpha-tubulin suppressor-like RCC1 family protein
MSSSGSRGAWLASACALVAALALIAPSRADSESASSVTRPVQAGYLDAGIQHTCAILADRTLRCWGKGLAGRLGYGSDAAILLAAAAPPVDLGPGRSARAIAAGDFHTCAVLDDGSVKCWGFGANGRLGYGSAANVSFPAAAPPVDLGPGRRAVAITAGTSHTCAILDTGAVRCWGNGSDGRLGYGHELSVGDDETPGAIAPVDLGPGRSARAIAAGDFHTCAILDDGSMRCWGFGASGQLGNGGTGDVGDNESPASAGLVALPAGRAARAVAGGAGHTCAILDDGSVRCWGFGANGRLGYGSTSTLTAPPGTLPQTAGPVDVGPGRSAPALTLGGAPTPTTPAAPDEGTGYTCALLDDGTLRCWGYGVDGRLGYGDQAQVAGTGFPSPAAKGPVPLGAMAGSLADLSVGLSASAAQVPLGGSAGLAVRVTNAGPDPAAVAVSIPPAAGSTYTGAAPSQGGVDGATGRWEVGGLAPGASAALQLTARLGAAGTHQIAAQLAASSIPDRAGEDDRASVVISVPAALSGKALRLVPRRLGLKVVRFPRRGRAKRLTVSGVLKLPVRRPPVACGGRVQVRALVGKRVVASTIVKLRRRAGACRYTAVLRPKQAKTRSARVVKVTARFLGNAHMRPRAARTTTVRIR